jgi:hypothetical protein
MFPLPILTYVKLGIAALSLLLAAYLGYSFEHSRFVAFKATIVAETAAVEREHQFAADQIRKEKDAKIDSINTQLANAISELRQRPSRAQGAGNGQVTSYCTGSQLYAEDAELALREAARADTIREALKACYKQYDSLK